MDITRRSFLKLSVTAAGAAVAGAALTACGGSASSSAASSASSGSASASAASSSAASASASSAAAASSSAASAAASAAAEKTKVVIGVRSDGIDQFNVVEDELKALGYDVEAQVFDDSVQPDVALAEGSIDCNWYQHEPYMQAYNEQNGTDLVMVQPKTAAPLFGMYSTKHKAVADIPDGAKFGMCNDATNQDRGLRLLAKEGLIQLPASADTAAVSIVEITEDLNPHKFEFIEGEMQVLPQSINDLDAICLAAAHMANAGMDAKSYIAKSDDEEKYAVGFVVRPEDKDAQWIKDIAKGVQCDDLAKYFEEEKQGTMLPMWK
ncbi:MAG: metal ABC transporter substrate-binding protein [Eggerthellaceae bacterium]|nr:metal ABC transporter substrate-binding protein [Eggerthellaceae bacterium]